MLLPLSIYVNFIAGLRGKPGASMSSFLPSASLPYRRCVIPAKAGIQNAYMTLRRMPWIPAFAGKTRGDAAIWSAPTTAALWLVLCLGSFISCIQSGVVAAALQICPHTLTVQTAGSQ